MSDPVPDLLTGSTPVNNISINNDSNDSLNKSNSSTTTSSSSSSTTSTSTVTGKITSVNQISRADLILLVQKLQKKGQLAEQETKSAKKQLETMRIQIDEDDALIKKMDKTNQQKDEQIERLKKQLEEGGTNNVETSSSTIAIEREELEKVKLFAFGLNLLIYVILKIIFFVFYS